MAQTLRDLNLQQVPDPYFIGSWRVMERVLNRADPTSVLAQATHLYLHEGELRLDAPIASQTGRWQVERDGLLGRPYLLLEFAQEQVKALITRLRHSFDGKYQTLTLYFQSGLELLLSHP
jgi:hypothetical protein